MLRNVLTILAVCVVFPMSSFAQLQLPDEIEIPTLDGFKPLPAEDPEFNKQLEALVIEAGLDEMTPASENPDNEDEWSSICLVDLSDLNAPRVAGWKADNFIYPASSYKLYVMGEAIRQVCEGELSLDDKILVEEHNVRSDSRLTSGQQVSLSDVLRLTMAYSDNTASNLAIDTVNRYRASALLRAMGLQGSDITRKFLPRSREDEGFADVPGTTTNARHFATFINATEQAAIGGGRGRGLIKGYMAQLDVVQDRMRAGLPDSATLYSKNGEWSIFTSQVALIEDGETKYILCVLTPYRRPVATPRIAEFTRLVHEMMKN